MASHVALGRLAPIRLSELEAYARATAEFCKVHSTPDHVVTTWIEPGQIELRWQGPGATDGPGEAQIRLEAGLAAGLQNLRDTLAHMLDSAAAGLSAGIHWQAEQDLAGQLPPNFRLARVTAAERISRRFIRLQLDAEDLTYLNQNGLHLRLLQPRDAKAPAWPHLAANGRTVWPAAQELHKPVYTIRRIDVAAGRLEVDVFIHGNGPTCAWAQGVACGAPIGLTGPGGGWLPEGRHLCLGGDETALPVIARILETAPADAHGEAVIEVEDRAEVQPIAAPAGVTVNWLLRAAGDPPLATAFAAAAERILARDPTAEVQFAGERGDATALRSGLRDRFGKLPATVTCATYWTRTPG